MNEILIENNFNDIKIDEKLDNSGNKSLYIVGPYIQTEIKNQNGRIYPKALMEKAVKEYDETFIQTNRALGELNHPESRIDVDPERACILIKELKEDTKDNRFYIGKAKVLTKTPLGALVEGLMTDGVTLGVSTRGNGSLKEDRVSSYNLKTTDVVHDPSAQTAFVNSLMESVSNGNKQYIYDVEAIFTRLAKLEEALESGSYKKDKSGFEEAIRALKI